MIVIDTEGCDGCGACIEVCPTGALYLVDDKAAVDGALCSDCESCLAACPTKAILSAEPVTTPATESARMPALRPEPELVWVETHPSAPLRTKALPMVGAALAWTAREIVPRLAEYWLDSTDRRVAQQRATDSAQHRPGIDPLTGRCGGGRRHRRRRRGK